MQNIKEKQIRERESHYSTIEILNRRNHELRLLYETSRFFSSTLNINELYDKLFEVLRNIVDMQDMFVATFNEEQRKIKYIYLRSVLEEKNIDVSVIPEIPLAPEGRGILSEAIRKNDTIVVEDYQKRLKSSSTKYHVTNEGSLAEEDHGKEYQIESAMIVPIKLNGKILGFITLMSQYNNIFNEDNLHWIETVVNQASIANKNAILYSESVSELKEIKLLAAQLDKSKSENVMLRSELTGRVKENMKIFSELLRFQADYVKDPANLEYLRVMRSRADAIALIQEELYSHEDISQINFEAYLYTLIPQLYAAYDVALSRISTYIDVKNIMLPIDKAISASLMINELVSHALLHSFPNKKKGNITIEMYEENAGKYYLSVRDNGAGIISTKGKPSSFSMVLVGMFVKNLKGVFTVDRKSGTKVEIRF
jgi:two-component sensor histidine kinase